MLLDSFQNAHIQSVVNDSSLSNSPYPSELNQFLNNKSCQEAIRNIKQWHSYSPTPLHQLKHLAQQLNVGDVYYKDESERFGLGSFKALGGAYALLQLLKRELTTRLGHEVSTDDINQGKYAKDCKKITVITATDGNHGRSVAWGAKIFGCQCYIYMHTHVSKGRQKAVEDLGATVVRVNGNYDESVEAAYADAKKNNWFVVSDTSDENTESELPGYVMAGYTIMVEEILNQMGDKTPTHVFVQGGVGGLAGSVCSYLWQRLEENRPKMIVVEPNLADCLYQSAKNKKATEVKIENETIMAGLSCGKVSYIAWEILRRGAQYFMTITDDLVPETMKMLAKGEFGDSAIIAGESAVAGLAGLLAISFDEDFKKKMEINKNSKILLIGTEGATDPEIYHSIINS